MFGRKITEDVVLLYPWGLKRDGAREPPESKGTMGPLLRQT